MDQNPFTEGFLVIAEKPSVDRTIAQVLVCEDRKDGYRSCQSRKESPDFGRKCVIHEESMI